MARLLDPLFAGRFTNKDDFSVWVAIAKDELGPGRLALGRHCCLLFLLNVGQVLSFYLAYY